MRTKEQQYDMDKKSISFFKRYKEYHLNDKYIVDECDRMIKELNKRIDEFCNRSSRVNR